MSALTGLCALVALLAVVGGRVGGKPALAAVGVGWVALIVGVGLVLFGEVSLIDIAAMGMLGSIAVQPIQDASPSRGLMGAGLGTAALLMALQLLEPSAPVGGSTAALLLGVWAALSAALGLFVYSIFDDNQNHQLGAGIAVAGAMMSALFLAASRNVLGDFGYYLFLGGESGRLYWELPGVERLTDGLRLAVSASLPPWVMVGLIGGALVAIVAAILPFTPWSRFRSYAWALVLVTSLALLGAVLTAETEAIPGPDRYPEFGRQVLLKAQASEAASSLGKFTEDVPPSVHAPSILPDVVLLSFAAIWSFLALLGSARREEHPAGSAQAHETSVKAVTLLWLTWFLSGLYHIGLLGTPGMRSGGEWMTTGLVLFATGLALIAFGERHRFSWGVSLAAGVSSAGIVVVATIAAAFGSTPWISLSLF